MDWIPTLGNDFESAGMVKRDWVTLHGRTSKEPYLDVYHTTVLIADCDGTLFPATRGAMGQYQIGHFLPLTIKGVPQDLGEIPCT